METIDRDVLGNVNGGEVDGVRKMPSDVQLNNVVGSGVGLNSDGNPMFNSGACGITTTNKDRTLILSGDRPCLAETWYSLHNGS